MILVLGLHKFVLGESSLPRLGKTRILLRVFVRRANVRQLFKLAPHIRKIKMEEIKIRNYELLKKHWPGENPQRIGSIQSPGGLVGWIAAKDFSKLYKLPVEDIWVEKIEGKKPIIERRHSTKYFGMKARYAIQIEGYKKGLQTFEDRVLLVRARTVSEAEKIVKKDSADYGEPYLNSDGEMVRWALEKIVDIYDTISSDVEEPLSEVYSELRSRRMKPQYVWNPSRKK